MPTGLRLVKGMAQIVELSDADLEHEFRDDEDDDDDDDVIEEGDEEEEEGGMTSKVVDGSRTSSTDLSTRPSSGESLKASSGSGQSDQPGSDDAAGSKETNTTARGDKRKNSGSTVWQSLKKKGGELNEDTRKVFRYIGRKLHRGRGSRETKVKEIHILPGDDDRMWARRLAGSANSRSSSGSDPVT